MREKFLAKFVKDAGARGLVLIAAAMLVLGGIGGAIFERTVLPYLSGLPGLRELSFLESRAPIVITRREEIRIDEGVNRAEIVSRVREGLATVYFHEGGPALASSRVVKAVPGVAVTSDGVIAVASGDLDDRYEISVAVYDREPKPAVVLADDIFSGLAFLKIEESGLPAPAQVPASAIRPGDRIFAVRTTLQGGTNISVLPLYSAQAGLVSPGLVEVYSMQQVNEHLFLYPEPGSQERGAVLLDGAGRMAGIVAGDGRRTLFLGSEYVQLAMNKLLKNNEIEWPAPRITYQVFGPVETALHSLGKPAGVLITTAAGGLKVNDFVYAVDGLPITAEDDFQKRILGRSPGEKVLLGIVRDGRELEVELEL